jgi:fructan beta-fructosidase
MRNLVFGGILALAAMRCVAQLPDIVVADFEGSDYGAWKTTGEAFGPGPASGSLPSQQEVRGFLGQGLVNSFHGGDGSTGTLTSPEFKIERKFITFLIGGGGFAGKTCVNLLMYGKVARTAVGPNTQDGGSEALAPASWDVSSLAGQKAQIQVMDDATGSWGHINLDQVVQTDSAPPAPIVSQERRVLINADFLKLPLMQRADSQHRGVERFTIESGGKVVRFVHLEIAGKDQRPDFMYSYDVREFRGREVIFKFRSRDLEVLNRLQFSNEEIIDPKAYSGPHRPKFHFSPRIGWMNDVNGTYYHKGLYHLFYQANPTTTAWSTGFDMHWGHSVSKDLVHWEEWPIALFPDATGNCFSGTALLLNERIPGINDQAMLPTPALVFTGTGGYGNPVSQHLATSDDGGKMWKRFAGNPILPKLNRDPKVFWHEESKHYIMLLYVGKGETGDPTEGYAIYRSKKLTDWEKVGLIPGWSECPEITSIKSAVTGKNVWLLYGAWRSESDSKVFYPSGYLLGYFDGTNFSPLSKHRLAHQRGNFYAALTFVNQPDGRRIMMGWASGTKFPGEPFNQCASLPLELSLKAFNGEDTLCFEPVREVNALRGKPLLELKNVTAAEANVQLQNLAKDALLDVLVLFQSKSNAPVTIRSRKITFNYDPATSIVKHGGDRTPIHPGQLVAMRMLVDHGIVESFWNGGEAAYSTGSLQTDDGPAFSIEGNAVVEELTVYPMADIWSNENK